MRKVFFLIILTLTTILAIKAEDKVIIAAADPWPPFINPEDPSDGLCMKIIKESFKTQGYKVIIEYVPWARAVNGVKNGKYDILPDVWFSEKRSEFLFFSNTFLVNKLKFMKLKTTTFEYSGIESLKGKSVGTIRDFSYDQQFMDSDFIIKEPNLSLKQNILKLLHKRIDLIIEDEIVAMTVLKKQYPQHVDKVTFCTTPLSSNNLYIAAGYKNPRHKEIIEAFNKGLEEIKETGLYDTILKSYFITAE